jgi:very-short-patch-repair endonuclease
MALAADQHGVVSRRQLERAGISADVADRYIRIGRMARLHRGVYHLGPAIGPLVPLVAATLACGDTAALSHRSGAGLWRMRAESDDIVDVTVSGRSESRAGIRVHRAQLRPDEVTVTQGMRVTTPARTLYDLAGMVAPIQHAVDDSSRVVSHRDVERALAEALVLRLTTRRAMLALLDHHHGHGAGLLRELLESDVKPALTRSEAEERFLDLVRRGDVGDPAVNVIVERYEVDFLWRAERLIVEVDGHRYHASKRAFESDRRRDAVLAAAGYTVMRVTWDQLTREREAVLVRLVRTLCRMER